MEFTAEVIRAIFPEWSKRQNKVASIARGAIAKDKIPPPRGWAGLARVGRGVASQGKHIRDRTEKYRPHKGRTE